MFDFEFLIWIIIYVVIILTLIFVIFIIRLLLAEDYPDKIEQLDLSNIQTGDIIGAAYQRSHGYFVSFWSASIWSHVGLAWRDPITQDLFVLEAAVYKDRRYRGILKVPILDWIRFNRKGYMGVTRLIRTKNSPPIDPIKMIQIYQGLQKLEIDSFNWGWTRLLFKTPYTPERMTHYTCYELTVLMLQEIGVVAKKYRSSSYFPGDIMSGNLDFVLGYSVDPIVFVDTTDYYRVIKT
jgi:hypothetical protein